MDDFEKFRQHISNVSPRSLFKLDLMGDALKKFSKQKGITTSKYSKSKKKKSLLKRKAYKAVTQKGQM